jgi:hypothetical protein
VTVQNFRLAIHVGPCAVKEYADRLRAAGWDDVVEGTEHVYGTISGVLDCPDAIARAAKALGHRPYVTGHRASAPVKV